MRRSLWGFVLLLLTSVVCVAAIPPTDLPETNYNEVDLPVNQAPPVVLGIRFVRPIQVARTVPRSVLQTRWDVQFPVEELVSLPPSLLHDPHSIQDVLCALLI